MYDHVLQSILRTPKTWLITGVAGFIGSNLLETLLKHEQTVRGLDNFATGHQHNLDEVRQSVSDAQWRRFTFIEGDIRDLDTCRNACARAYGFKSIGLRYFNVFGPRQDPNGAYAAVIPKWFAGIFAGGPVYINGDGETSRDSRWP